MSKIKCIGIIAEDNSDYEAFKVLIKRITNKDKLSFKKAIGNGCGKLKRKADVYFKDLKNRGCNMVILVHDLDKNKLNDLEILLNSKKSCASESNEFVCIPIEELEAWFLSDPLGIKTALNLKSTPKINGLPENINSPKEYIEEQVAKCSENEKVYINTKHNTKISESVSIELMKEKCASFEKLYSYLNQYKY